MERYFRKIDTNNESYVRSNNVFNPPLIRQPVPLEIMNYQQEPPLMTLHPRNQNMNVLHSRLSEIPTPPSALQLYYGGAGNQQSYYNIEDYHQEPSFNEYQQLMLMKSPRNTNNGNNMAVMDEDVNHFQQYNPSKGNSHARTQTEVLGHVSGYSGSAAQLVQTSTGCTSVANDSKAHGKQRRLSEQHMTCEKPVDDNINVSSRDGLAKDVVTKQKTPISSGMRVFTGSVEKVMKWHRDMSGTNVHTLYEVIGRCVSVRSGKGCEKLLLLRDSSGPVLQATYYEIDFLLSDTPPGSTLRIIGKMVGSNRMVAYKVRGAITGETSSLPRLCAITQHMVTKILNLKH